MSRYTLFFICAVSAIGIVTDAARILAVFPYPSHSHHVVFRAITKELWKRGHELVIFTAEPINDTKMSNYTEIDLSDLRHKLKTMINFYDGRNMNIFQYMRQVVSMISSFAERALSDPNMERLVHPNSTEKFDVILLQSLYMDALYGLAARFNAPTIGIVTTSIMTYKNYIIGNPILPAYSPDLILGFTDQMNLWERIQNLYFTTRQVLEYLYIFLPLHDNMMRKYLGDDIPYIENIVRNVSVVLSYTNPFFAYQRPNVPSLVYFGGCHLDLQNTTIPDDLKKILDESKEGVIYFSLGSNVKSIHMPEEIRDMLLSIFAELPYKVIWKFEGDDLVTKSSNVIVRKWLPQQAILAHPNIVLFMYQGGMQSTEEAVGNALPLIGFPMFSDQTANINRLQNLGIAKHFDLLHFDKAALKRAIVELITDPKYKERAVQFRKVSKDLPYEPMEHAIWWIEHVIRHKGASHLYSRSRDIPFYQTVFLDVIGIFAIVLILLLYVTIVIFKCLIRRTGFICWQSRKNVKTE